MNIMLAEMKGVIVNSHTFGPTSEAQRVSRLLSRKWGATVFTFTRERETTRFVTTFAKALVEKTTANIEDRHSGQCKMSLILFT